MAYVSSKTFIKHYCRWRQLACRRPCAGWLQMRSFQEQSDRWAAGLASGHLTDADCALVEQDPELQVAIWWQVKLENQCVWSDNLVLQAMLENQERNVWNTCQCLRKNSGKRFTAISTHRQNWNVGWQLHFILRAVATWESLCRYHLQSDQVPAH